jgi:hypothetical protein
MRIAVPEHHAIVSEAVMGGVLPVEQRAGRAQAAAQLAHVYAQLGVPNRAAVATAAASREITLRLGRVP